VNKSDLTCLYLIRADSVYTGIRIAIVDIFLTRCTFETHHAVAFEVPHEILAITVHARSNCAVIDVDLAIESIEARRAIALVRSG
jgi:hypothetical protein